MLTVYRCGVVILLFACASSRSASDHIDFKIDAMEEGFSYDEFWFDPLDTKETSEFKFVGEEPIVLGDGQGTKVTIYTRSPVKVEIETKDKPKIKSGSGFIYIGATNAPAGSYVDPYDPYYPVTWMRLEKVIGIKDKTLLCEYGDGRLAFMSVEFLALGKVRWKVVLENKTNESLMRIGFSIDDSVQKEEFYGLGEYFDTPVHRGKRRAMHFELSDIESSNNEAHVPIPLLISTRGWGLFVESRRPGVFDVGASQQDEIWVDFETDDITFYTFVRAKPMEVLQDYVDLTGRPRVPAIWAFAPIFWRNENKHQDEVLEDANKIRELGIPSSLIWIDNPWQTAYNTFVFDPSRFPDANKMIKTLNELGFRVAVWSTPYIEPKTGDDYNYAKEKGFFVEGDAALIFQKFGRLIDLTNPNASEWWKTLINRATSIGIEGFKLDYGEDVQVGIAGNTLPYIFYNGLTSHDMHHYFQIFFHKPYAEMLPTQGGGFILSRGGTYGDQAYTTTIWPGDLDNGFEHFGEEKKGVKHVGGLPSAVVGGLSLAVSGYPFYASDTGGFRHGRPTKHAFMRWFEYSAFCPIMQIGGGGENHNPWDFNKYGESQFDQEVLDAFIFYARFHMRLFPYFYTLALQAHETGQCITCPVGFIYPEDGKHPIYDFLVGDILVSPVVDEGFKKKVWIPSGHWYSWGKFEHFMGHNEVEVEVGLHEIPIFLREGAIIPMLEPDIVTLSPVAENKQIRSYVTDPGGLHVIVLPPGESKAIEVFTGAKFSTAPVQGGFSLDYVHSAMFKKGPRLEIVLKANPLGILPKNIGIKGEDDQFFTEVFSVDALEECNNCYLPLFDVGKVVVQLYPKNQKVKVIWW